MKSVFKNMFACNVLMLASVAANATTGHWALSHAELGFKHDHATCSLVLDASKNTYSSISLNKVASTDEEQADSSDAETMLA